MVGIAAALLILYFLTRAGADKTETNVAPSTEFAAYLVTGTANVRERPARDALILARVTKGGLLEGAIVHQGDQRWLRIGGDDFSGKYVWAGNLKGVAENAGPRATFLAAAEPPPSREWLIGRWKDAGQQDCLMPAWHFRPNFTADNYEYSAEWELDMRGSGRLAISWLSSELNDTLSGTQYFKIERRGPNILVLQGENERETARLTRC